MEYVDRCSMVLARCWYAKLLRQVEMLTLILMPTEILRMVESEDAARLLAGPT